MWWSGELRDRLGQFALPLALIAVCLLPSAGSARADSFDWRNVDGQNYMTRAKQQGPGQCWAFAGIATIEAKIKIALHNPACDIDNVNNENISWSGSAPRGEYIVRVDYYDGCGVEETDYVVTVRVEGRQPETFTGTFTGSGDQGGPGSGVEITRFTF